VTEIIMGLVGAVLALIGFFLRQKDEQQQGQIKMLFEKHEEDAQRLANLELQIAREHPNRNAIREMFGDFKAHMDERFDRLEQAVGVERRNGK